MEAGSATTRGRVGWRLWAVVPVLLLALAVGVVVTSGSALVDLVGTNPPPADKFDIRRVEFSPGEIRIIVRNPQLDDLTIASVSVAAAIVPFSLDGPTTLGRLRDPVSHPSGGPWLTFEAVLTYRWCHFSPVC